MQLPLVFLLHMEGSVCYEKYPSISLFDFSAKAHMLTSLVQELTRLQPSPRNPLITIAFCAYIIDNIQ